MTASYRMSRIELERRILSRALRLSWVDSDEDGLQST